MICPKCGSTDIQGISRVTGYLSLDERFGPGKYHEREDRVSHTSKYIIIIIMDVINNSKLIESLCIR